MRVYRHSRRVNGKRVLDSHYSGRFRLAWMPRESSTALKTSDKQVAEKRLREFVQVKEFQKEGLPIPSGLWGAPRRDTATSKAQYLESLASLGRKEKHVRGTGVNLDRLISEIGWLTLEDITAA